MGTFVLNIVPLSIVTVVTLVTLDAEWDTIRLDNVRLDLTIRMVLVGTMAHFPTRVACMGGSQWCLHGWALLWLSSRTAVAITAMKSATRASMLELGRGFKARAEADSQVEQSAAGVFIEPVPEVADMKIQYKLGERRYGVASEACIDGRFCWG